MKKAGIVATVAAATLGVAALTGAAVAVAADDSTASKSPSASTSDRDGNRGSGRGHGPGDGSGMGRGHGPGEGHGPGGPGMGHEGERGHMLHGEGVVEQADGTFVTVRTQEGEVTEVSATSITVKSVDGHTSTYAINADTELERDRAEGAPLVGDTVHVRATVNGSTATADDIHALSPEQAKAMEEHRAAMDDWMSERPEGPEGPGRA